MLNEDFFKLFVESVRFRDFGLLKSSLEKREEATLLIKNNAGYYALGKANEATLLGHHIGDGLMAYEASKESLKDLSAFADADQEWRAKARFSLVFESFAFIVNWAESYQEYIKYCELSDHWTNIPVNDIRLGEARKYQKKGQMWWKTQFAIAQNFYSRVSQERDAGKHASAMAILNCIIDRAYNEAPGYEMDSKEIFNILDDYIALTIQAYMAILKKYRKALDQGVNLGNIDAAAEQFIIFKAPLKYWLLLMPHCPKKWIPTFKEYYDRIMRMPVPVYPDIMQQIGVFFEKGATPVKTKSTFLSGKKSKNRHAEIPPLPIKRSIGCASVIIIANIFVIGSLWYWAIKIDEIRWYDALISVITICITISPLPFYIKNIFNRKNR